MLFASVIDKQLKLVIVCTKTNIYSNYQDIG